MGSLYGDTHDMGCWTSLQTFWAISSSRLAVVFGEKALALFSILIEQVCGTWLFR